MQLQIGWINQSWNSTSSIKQLYHWIPYSINLEFSKLLSTIGIQAISTFRSLDQALVTNINWVQLFEVAGWPTLGALRSNENLQKKKQKDGLKSQRNTGSIVWSGRLVNYRCTLFQWKITETEIWLKESEKYTLDCLSSQGGQLFMHQVSICTARGLTRIWRRKRY